jgi:hypothetical protein
VQQNQISNLINTGPIYPNQTVYVESIPIIIMQLYMYNTSSRNRNNRSPGQRKG